MKKLSVIIAMILVVTIGAVYATWYYGTEPVAKLEGVRAAAKSTIVVESSSKGALEKVTASTNPEVTIAETSTAYVPSITASGTITVKFTPSTTYDTSKSLSIKATIGTVDDPDNLIDYTAKEVTQVATAANEWTVTFNCADLFESLGFSADYTANPLNTADEYHTFMGSWAKVTFPIVISEATGA